MRKNGGNGLPAAIDGHPVFTIRRAHQTASAVFASFLAEPNLTSAQYCVLFLLQHLGPSSQNELGRLAHLDRCTISVVVRNLKTRGLISASRDSHDGRKRLIELTTHGKDLLPRASRLSAWARQAVFSVLTDAETRQLMRTLKKLVGAHAARFPGDRPPS